MIPYVVYSHTDYLKVLEIQSDYIQKCPNRVLLINTPVSGELDYIEAKYDKVVYYNDTLQYTDRVAQGLESINSKYILFTHDIDILLNIDLQTIEQLVTLAEQHNIDRIDLKHTPVSQDEQEHDNEVVLRRVTDVNSYMYNVNPSIWKVDAFRDLLSNFKNRNYRNIEDLDVQKFCLKYNMYKAHSNTFLKCGYYNCMSFYTFLHISHAGRLLTLNEESKTEYGQSYQDVRGEFEKIVDKYNLR
jgi:hypothetical protein